MYRPPLRAPPQAEVADILPLHRSMQEPVLSLRRAAILTTALALVFTAMPARAQQAASNGADGRRVERLVIRGAEALGEGDLRASIVTRQTRCISLLLRPVCALTNWGLLLDEYHLDVAELRADEVRLRVHYFQRGYRSAQVASEVRRRGGGVEVIFEIDEGPPTRISARSLVQAGDVLSDRRIRRADLPRKGEPLDLLRLGLGMADLATAYGERGHLDAVLRDSIAVMPDGLDATLAIVLEPGPRATLDTLDVQGNERVSAGAIAEALRLRHGRVLRTNDVAASQRSLYESNLFHEARVRVPEQPDSAKRVEITVREAPPRGAQVGGGFNTVEFIQADARFTHYDWLGGSRRLDLRATVGNLLARQLNDRSVFRNVLPEGPTTVDEAEFLRPTWQASAEFRQPTFLSAANVLGVAVFAHRRTIPGIAVDEGFGGDVSVTRRLDFPTPVTAAYRFEMAAVLAGDLYFCVNYGICEPVTIDALRGRHSMSPVSLSFVDNRADDPIAPSTGYRIRAELQHASALTLSDFRFQRLSAAGAYYLPLDLHRRRVLAGRLRLGWVRPLAGTAAAVGLEIDADPEPLLHPRKRFYSGGSRSVRGYQENQLGPRVLTVDPDVLREEAGCTSADIADGSCDPADVSIDAFDPRPVGGRSVVEANVEYRFPLTGALQGAVFLDGALVADGVQDLLRSGGRALTPGFGARWQSPVGPIRIDLGIRPLLVEQLDVITEVVGDDGVRRLVRLDTPRRYNPLEDATGFLDQVLGRLVVHLSIGEAF
jgi:outer membrane protein insertion porin family